LPEIVDIIAIGVAVVDISYVVSLIEHSGISKSKELVTVKFLLVVDMLILLTGSSHASIGCYTPIVESGHLD